MKNKFDYHVNNYLGVLGVIILMGIFLRLVFLSNLGGMGWDEASHSLAGVLLARLVHNGFDIGYLHKFISNYWASAGSLFFFPWGYSILTALSFLFFGFNELAARLPSWVFSVLLIFVTYLLAEKLFDKKIGLLAAFITAVNPWIILWGSQALADVPMVCLMILAIYFCLQGIEKPGMKYWIWSGLAGGLAGLMKPPGFIIFPFLAFTVSYFQGLNYLMKKQFLVLALIGFICFLSYFGFGLLAILVLPRLGIINAESGLLIFKSIFQWFGRFLPSNFFQWFGKDLIYADLGDPNFKSLEGWLYYLKLIPAQMGGYLVVILSIIGAIKLFLDKNFKRNLYLIFTFVISIYLIFTFIANKDTRFTLPYLPFFCILAGIGVSFLISIFKTKLRVVFLVLILAVILVVSTQQLNEFAGGSDIRVYLVDAINTIINSKPGLVVPAQESNDVSVQNVSFYLVINDPELKYSVYWPDKIDQADYIISREVKSYNNLNLLIKYGSGKLYLFGRTE
ncbi:MAG: glycosyltransferase family 39 protein [Patescibacteria group bacterium]|jgi:4-amino-4-deoxy-L-arabinose transferase-like glycosyltransferase